MTEAVGGDGVVTKAVGGDDLEKRDQCCLLREGGLDGKREKATLGSSLPAKTQRDSENGRGESRLPTWAEGSCPQGMSGCLGR